MGEEGETSSADPSKRTVSAEVISGRSAPTAELRVEEATDGSAENSHLRLKPPAPAAEIKADKPTDESAEPGKNLSRYFKKLNGMGSRCKQPLAPFFFCLLPALMTVGKI